MPLHKACTNGHVEVVMALLEKGVDVNAKARYEITPLHYARLSGFCSREKLIAMLLKKGAVW